MTDVITTVADLRERLGTGPLDADAPSFRRPCVVVMTMGALHEGHLELVRAATAWLGNRGLGPGDADVVLTDFVNPLQFSDGADLAKYPRTLDEDIALCRAAGVDIVFAPTVDEMYPSGDPQVTIDPGELGAILEGQSRPGHFRGMLTVVNRLMMLIEPAAAMFGEKDYQQLTLIRRMVDDLLIPVHVVGVPTVREDDGLAMSSRNRRLSTKGRHAASAVPLSLRKVESMLADGVPPRDAAARAQDWLAEQPGISSVDYLEVTDVALGEPPARGEARVLVAAVVDGVRLIDNGAVMIGESA